MSDDPKPAARKGDFIAHDNSQAAKFIGFVAIAAASARWVKVSLFASGGVITPQGAAAFAGATIIEWAVSNFVEAQLEKLAAAFADPGIPEIATGSDNVFVNALPAARGAKMDLVKCHSKPIEQGSEWVTINKAPAARWTDRTSCGGGAFLTKNPALIRENVLFGGPPTDFANKAPYHQAAEALLTLFKGRSGFEEAAEQAAGKTIEKLGDWVTK
jgi:uncharacterized Zn-binding protein involved in type VI secretion